MPAPDGGDDLTRVGGPNKRLGRLVCLLDEAIDRGFKLDDGMEDAALQALLGQFRKVSLHCIEPGTGRGREVKEEALVACEPRQNGWMLTWVGASGARLDFIRYQEAPHGALLVRRRWGDNTSGCRRMA